MRKRKKMYKPIIINRFSMVEMMLCVFIVAIGMMGITTLIPTGLDKQGKSLGTTYSVDAGDQFVRYNAGQIRADKSWADQFPTEKPPTNEFKLEGWNSAVVFSNGNTSIFEALDPNSGMFLHEQSNGENVEYQAVFRVWKNVETRDNGAENIILFLEASWPAEHPYYAREKSTFTMETFKAPEIVFDRVMETEVCSIFDYALYNGVGDLSFKNVNNVTIDGDVRAENGNFYGQNLDSLTINGGIVTTGDISFSNVQAGNISGSLYSEQSIFGDPNVIVEGTENQNASIGDFTLPTLVAPTDANDPNYLHPILIVDGDYTINGSVVLEGTIYATGDIFIHSGQSITGSGVLLAGGEIFISSISGTLGGPNSEIFLYALGADIHLNNCNNVDIRGIIYAPNGGFYHSNGTTVNIIGGIYTNAAMISFVNISGDITIGTGKDVKNAIPPGLVCNRSGLAVAAADDSFTLDAGTTLIIE